MAGCGVEFVLFCSDAVTLYHAAQERAHGGDRQATEMGEDRGFDWQGPELGRRSDQGRGCGILLCVLAGTGALQ